MLSNIKRILLQENVEMGIQNWEKHFRNLRPFLLHKSIIMGVERLHDTTLICQGDFTWTQHELVIAKCDMDKKKKNRICMSNMHFMVKRLLIQFGSIPNGLWMGRGCDSVSTESLTWQVHYSLLSILKTLSIKPYHYAVSVCVHSKILSRSKRGK